MMTQNHYKIQYKLALILASLALFSQFLITYSSIINLKYTMNHYKKQRHWCRAFGDYLMLTCLGILTTVIPMHVFDILRYVAVVLAAPFKLCNTKAIENVEGWFDYGHQKLASIT